MPPLKQVDTLERLCLERLLDRILDVCVAVGNRCAERSDAHDRTARLRSFLTTVLHAGIYRRLYELRNGRLMDNEWRNMGTYVDKVKEKGLIDVGIDPCVHLVPFTHPSLRHYSLIDLKASQWSQHESDDQFLAALFSYLTQLESFHSASYYTMSINSIRSLSSCRHLRKVVLAVSETQHLLPLIECPTLEKIFFRLEGRKPVPNSPDKNLCNVAMSLPRLRVFLNRDFDFTYPVISRHLTRLQTVCQFDHAIIVRHLLPNTSPPQPIFSGRSSIVITVEAPESAADLPGETPPPSLPLQCVCLSGVNVQLLKKATKVFPNVRRLELYSAAPYQQGAGETLIMGWLTGCSSWRQLKTLVMIDWLVSESLIAFLRSRSETLRYLYLRVYSNCEFDDILEAIGLACPNLRGLHIIKRNKHSALSVHHVLNLQPRIRKMRLDRQHQQPPAAELFAALEELAIDFAEEPDFDGSLPSLKRLANVHVLSVNVHNYYLFEFVPSLAALLRELVNVERLDLGLLKESEEEAEGELLDSRAKLLDRLMKHVHDFPRLSLIRIVDHSDPKHLQKLIREHNYDLKIVEPEHKARTKFLWRNPSHM